MFQTVQEIAVNVDFKCIAILRAEITARNIFDEVIFLHAVSDKIFNRSDLHTVELCKFYQVWQTRHSPIIIHNLTNHGRRIETCHAGNIDRGLCVTGTHKDAAIFGNERKHMARRNNIVWAAIGINRNLDRQSPVSRANPCCHAFAGFDRLGKGGFKPRGIIFILWF